jgi:hypothetical protein
MHRCCAACASAELPVRAVAAACCCCCDYYCCCCCGCCCSCCCCCYRLPACCDVLRLLISMDIRQSGSSSLTRERIISKFSLLSGRLHSPAIPAARWLMLTPALGNSLSGSQRARPRLMFPALYRITAAGNEPSKHGGGSG